MHHLNTFQRPSLSEEQLFCNNCKLRNLQVSFDALIIFSRYHPTPLHELENGINEFGTNSICIKNSPSDYFTTHNSHKTLELNLHLMCTNFIVNWGKKWLQSSMLLDFIESFKMLVLCENAFRFRKISSDSLDFFSYRSVNMHVNKLDFFVYGTIQKF